MREIKFRVWDMQNKEWLVYRKHLVGYRYPCDEAPVSVEIFAYCASDDSGFNELQFCLDNPADFIVEQFTGLRDKNGREIYEGDIINGMLVAYCGNQEDGLGMSAGWYLQRNDFEVWIELESKHNDNGDNYEVIGNIHEHPELLEAKP